MSASRSLTPDDRQLLEMFSTALTIRLTVSELNDDQTRTELDRLGVRVDPGRAADTSRVLHDLLWGGRYDLPELIARAGIVVAGSRILTTERHDVERAIGAHAGALVIRELAAKTGHHLAITAELNALLAQRGRALAVTLSYVRRHLRPDLTPLPRILFLTPLTAVPTGDRDRLLEVVGMARPTLKRMGTRIDVPGERLGPDTAIEWTSETMFATEREHILSGDLVVIIADKHQSYGAGQSQSWSETNQSLVYVLSEFTSRVLGCGYWGTEAEPFTTAHEVAANVVNLTRRQMPQLRAHAAQSAAIRRAWTTHVLLPSPTMLTGESADTPLTPRRRASLASDGLEVASMTLREYIDLRRSDPEQTDATIGSMLAELVNATAPETNPEPEAVEEQVALTVRSLVAGRQIGAANASMLSDFCKDMEVDIEELRILFAFEDNLVTRDADQLVGARTMRSFDRDWWTSTLAGIRTTRGTHQ